MTITLTHEDLNQLKDGADKFGRIMLRVTADDGATVYLVCDGDNGHRPRTRRRNGEPPKVARAGASVASPEERRE